ncbi:MAG: CopG family transcriptional regulator [Coriobacteriia bacterium]|nr:CopG family transcriptional regulator [Coriobacteriia bacterium]
MSIKTKNGVELTDEMIEQIAKSFERGEWPGAKSKIVQGRPLMLGEDLQSVTFRVPIKKVAALDKRAASLSMSRSDYLRSLLDNDLLLA